MDQLQFKIKCINSETDSLTAETIDTPFKRLFICLLQFDRLRDDHLSSNNGCD